MSRTITFDTGLDLKALEKDVNKAIRSVENIRNSLIKKEAKRSFLTQEAAEMAAKLDEAKAKLAELQNMSLSKKKAILLAGGNPDQMVADQAAQVAAMQKEYDKADASVQKIDRDIALEKDLLAQAEQNAKEQKDALTAAQEAAQKNVTVMQKASQMMDGVFASIGNRLKMLMKRLLIFSVITAGLQQVRRYLSDVINQNAEASQSIANMKTAFATLAQPLLQAVIPAIVALANWVTKVVTAIAQLIALITGKKLSDFKKAANGKKGGAGGGGGKGNDKSLAGFDTLNQLTGGAGGAGGAAAEMEAIGDIAELTQGEMTGILATIGLIGAALAAWKLPFGENLTFLERFVGYLLIIVGLVIAVRGYLDAWKNGVDWDNLLTILGGLAIALGGIYILFGTIGVAIGLVVGGIAILILAFKDIMENGTTLQNTVLLIIGVILTALGAFIGTSNPFFLIIGLIAALVLAVVAAGGELDGVIQGVKTILDGLIMFIKGVFTGDWQMAWEGIKTIFSGIWQVMSSVVKGILKAMGIDVDNLVKNIKLTFGGIIKFIKGVFTGDWQMAWDGVKDIFRGVFNTIYGIFGGIINKIIDGINYIIGGANKLIGNGLVSDAISLFTGGKYSNIPTIPNWPIPQLASGAVIPPNREFLAVLGDQSSGTNIEAPLETIVEAFQRVAGNQSIDIHFSGDLASVVRLMNPVIKRDNKRVGSSLVEV